MTPGMTSKGGSLPSGKEGDEEVVKGDVVVIRAEGKEEACMVGMLDVGSEEMKKTKKGVAISQGHYLGDGLWRLDLG